MAAVGTTDEVVFEVENLRTLFRTRWGTVKAVDGVNSDLRRRETLGIVGEAGHRKITNAKLILMFGVNPAV